MSIILYLETNFILAMAKGQNGLADKIWQNPPENLTIVMPSICLMESLVAWENEQKRSQSFRQAMKIEINEAKRNVRSEEARSVVNLLQESFISYENLLAELDNRLEDVLETLKNRVELIEPKIENLQSTLRQPSLSKKSERRDDFILQCILDHASSNPDKTKAFLSENSKQFGQPVVRNALRERGIRYFNNMENLQGWLQSSE
ncbi:MAG: DUF4935 domain-containing protein [Okeania sp. SIO2H7]|nr:DUF4935 domain-containing protein [Okeania sp. SIO2H7]